jgi:hypothetical protein
MLNAFIPVFVSCFLKFHKGFIDDSRNKRVPILYVRYEDIVKDKAREMRELF